MAHLVTPEEVKNMLRIDGDDVDGNLLLMIPAASGAVVNYLKAGARRFLDEAGEVIDGMEVPFEVRAATVILIGIMMRNPDNTVEGDFEQGYLPKPVTALLYPLRDPALA